MKKFMILLLGIAFLWSCNSTQEENLDYDSELTKMYDQFMKNELSGLQDFNIKINEFKTKANTDAFKSAPANGSEITLDFNKKGAIYQVVKNQYEDGSTLGMNNPYFGNQLTVKELIELSEQPIDSFKTYYNAKGRSDELNRLIDSFESYKNGLENIIVLKVLKNKLPTWYGDTYESGQFKGKILIYTVATEELLTIIDVFAVNSGTVESGSFKNLGEAAKSDYYKNINSAIEKNIGKTFKIKGKPSAIQVP